MTYLAIYFSNDIYNNNNNNTVLTITFLKKQQLPYHLLRLDDSDEALPPVRYQNNSNSKNKTKGTAIKYRKERARAHR